MITIVYLQKTESDEKSDREFGVKNDTGEVEYEMGSVTIINYANEVLNQNPIVWMIEQVLTWSVMNT